ncbi:MAG: alpha amylase C-terminal domain-containing protein [Lachnospiraceae bacterium]|nr:alpha amylase C-terminal domain-containing protein [Lachnospiraceae bacterium]
MAWYDEAIFYHIYPLGLLGCPHENDYGEAVHRLPQLKPWIRHIADMGFNGIYIGPLFESVGHGYETTDYYKLDSRLGTNQDLKDFVIDCHKAGIRVILDGVFNHTGRDFFAFKDIREHREGSRYLGWYSGVNLYGNNSFNDGFSYENWGGFDLLARLNQKNPEVQGYIADVIRFWAEEFDIDGLRLDAADVLDFDFMRMLRRVADEVKPEFYLMGEVIHGEYIRWERDAQIHAVTNYHLHKALYSGHNDHNYFEIAHTVKRLYDMGGGDPLGLRLYNFADNHDVERIYSRLANKAHFMPLHILMYTLPGIPSVYYGSEFGIEGRKGGSDDWGIRPALELDSCLSDEAHKPFYELIKALGKIRQAVPCLSYGAYEQLLLTNRQYCFARRSGEAVAVTAVNNDENPAWVDIKLPAGKYKAMLSGEETDASGGSIHYELKACGGEIFVKLGADGGAELPETEALTEIKTVSAAGSFPDREAEGTESKRVDIKSNKKNGDKASVDINNKDENSPSADDEGRTVKQPAKEAADRKRSVNENSIPEEAKTTESVIVPDKPYEEMTVSELQAAILQKMAKNGPVTEEMKRSVSDNIWKDSLTNWVKSFR